MKKKASVIKNKETFKVGIFQKPVTSQNLVSNLINGNLVVGMKPPPMPKRKNKSIAELKNTVTTSTTSLKKPNKHIRKVRSTSGGPMAPELN